MNKPHLIENNNTPITKECFKTINQEFENEITSIALITDDVNEVENWKGLGEPKKKSNEEIIWTNSWNFKKWEYT